MLECASILHTSVLFKFYCKTYSFPFLNKQSFVLIQDNRLLANMNKSNQKEHNQMTGYQRKPLNV